MKKDGGLICQQPVNLFISSNSEKQNLIAVARSKRPTSSVGNQQRQQTQSSSLSHLPPNVIGQIQEQFAGQGKIFENF
jgi:hypothetical protein